MDVYGMKDQVEEIGDRRNSLGKFVEGLLIGWAIGEFIEGVFGWRNSREERILATHTSALQNAATEQEAYDVHMQYRRAVARFRSRWYLFWALVWLPIGAWLLHTLLLTPPSPGDDPRDGLYFVISMLFWLPPLAGGTYSILKHMIYAKYLGRHPLNV